MLEVRGLSKRFGSTLAVDDVSFDVGAETVAILGPSGCGKSTLLRLIAGLETPDAGTVRWDGTDLADVSTHRRDFGLMFQSFALFPNRTVGRNVAFGLEMRALSRDAIDRRVREVLEWVGMEDKIHRAIEGLSGGELQRVALARTLAPEPQLIMFDEPLGSLDRLMRERLITEIGGLLRETGTPSIYVTHDHGEAVAVAERIMLMNEGKIVQTGTIDELRDQPASDWVRRFVGT